MQFFFRSKYLYLFALSNAELNVFVCSTYLRGSRFEKKDGGEGGGGGRGREGEEASLHFAFSADLSSILVNNAVGTINKNKNKTKDKKKKKKKEENATRN